MKPTPLRMIVSMGCLSLALGVASAAGAPAPEPPGATPPTDARPPATRPTPATTTPHPATPPAKRRAAPRAAPRRAADPAATRPRDVTPPPPPAVPGKKPAKAPDKTSKLLKKAARFLSFFKPSTVWYLQYRAGGQLEGHGNDATNYNRFFVGRGYVTLRFVPTKWFEARVTMDTHQDDEGDWKVRLKYMYAKFKVPIETRIISEPFAEIGIAHMPWLDYEEHINYYRAQGVMFAERNKLHNSADLGITVGTLLGRKLPKKVAKKMHDKYPGSWGSMAVGVYNGTGYHDLERNENKLLEGRISIRPGGPYFPYLQASYFFTYGKGARNLIIEDDPTTVPDESAEYAFPWWQNNIAMLSFAHQYAVVTAQYIFGKGTQKGDQSNWLWQPGEGHPPGSAKTYRGASVFAELRLPWIKSSIWGRYDWFDGPYKGGTEPYHRIFAAYAFHFWGRNKNFVMLDFEYVLFDDDGEPDPTLRRQNEWALTLTLQVKLK